MSKFNTIFYGVAIILILSGFYYAKKQWFDDGSVFTTATISANKVTLLAAAGGDMRLYEFTPQTAPYMQCIFIAGSNKGASFCFEKRNYVADDKK